LTSFDVDLVQAKKEPISFEIGSFFVSASDFSGRYRRQKKPLAGNVSGKRLEGR
jgi:hypothetical protein